MADPLKPPRCLDSLNALAAADAAADAAAAPALRRRSLVLGGAAAAGAALWPAASTQAQGAWPSRPVRVVVPFPPAGLTDAYARAYCEGLSRKFGQNFVIENKTGAGGTLGAGDVAKAAPDGHTLLITTSTATWTAKVLYKKLPYKAPDAFDPVALFPSGALLLCANEKLPVRTMKELVAYAAKNPAAWGTYGPGSWAHMLGDATNRQEKLNMVIAHYRGEAPMIIDLVGGQIQFGIGSVQGLLPHIQKGTLRALAATGPVRTPRLPDVSTLVEQGYTAPVYAMEGYLPFAAPAGTPRDILDKLSAAVAEISQTPALKQLREQFGIPAVPLANPAEVRKVWDRDSAEWIALATSLNLTLD